MKRINYFVIIFIAMFAALISTHALDASEITVENNKASFSKMYSKLEDAKKAVADFEQYVKDNKGVVLSTKTDTIINEINNEILQGLIEADTLDELADSVELLNNFYADMSDDDVSYKVVYGDVETIETEVVSHEYDSGEVGAYSSYRAASSVAQMLEAYNNRDDYEYRTRIARERRVINTLVAHINGSFNSEIARGIYLFGYSLIGYDLSNVDLSQSIVTDVTYETKEFSSFDERDAYIAQLESDGNRVSHELNSIHFNEVEEDVTSIDEDFDSIAALNDYISQLDQNYNHKEVTITDNSYDDVTNEVRSQDGFESEDAANEFIDNLRNDYLVFNEKVTSYVSDTTEDEDITKFFTSESAALNALEEIRNSLNNGESISSSGVTKLSLDEIDMDEVLTTGDTGLNSNNASYNSFGIDSNNTSRWNYLSINTPNGRRSGRVRITSITVNGTALISSPGFGSETYRLSSGSISNNSKVVVSGEVIYGNNRVNFTADGILNNANDHSRDRNTFEYSISDVTITREGAVVINDNLEDIYKLDVTKTKQVSKTLYKAEANIYRSRRVQSYNLSGTASNIRQVPVYVVDITKEKDRVLYNAIGDATLDIYGTQYVIYYDADRTIRNTVTSYRQEFSVIETVKEVSYLAEGNGNLNTIVAPNTGVDNSSNNAYLYMLLSVIPLGYILVRKSRRA